MCGIAGIINYPDKEIINRMIGAITHRGPDDRGTYWDEEGRVALGHCRLSIIDLSPGGHQPMSYQNDRYWITFNGEIYNYRELRKELENSGALFLSQSDTEVVLASFAIWGEKCLSRFRGMFAFAIWDCKERVLFLARDRLGIKPLLYYQEGERLIFASEMKALLASKLVEPVLNPEALVELLTQGSAIQPHTFIRGVKHLDPGTYMVFREQGRQEIKRYWDLVEASSSLRESYSRKPFTELVVITRQKLEEACRYHLISDVPVGSFLSGGIDSTAVTALMSRFAPYPIKSYTVGFEGLGSSKEELRFARITADKMSSQHTECIISHDEVGKEYDHFVEAIDQPSQDGPNTFFVSRTVNKEVKVVLSGLGGDELFVGYPHFKSIKDAYRHSACFLDGIMTRLYLMRPNRFCLVSYYRGLPMGERLAKVREILPDKSMSAVLNPSLINNLNRSFENERNIQVLGGKLDIITQISRDECQGYLINTLLRDNDVLSMAYSLEVRPVLLDHVLVEHAFALPPEAKLRNGLFKAALVAATKDLIPKGAAHRKKMGFEMPLGDWLQTSLKDRLLSVVNDHDAKEIFTHQYLNGLPEGLCHKGRARELWTVLIFVEWYKKYRCTLGK